jgi:hypothetical protein
MLTRRHYHEVTTCQNVRYDGVSRHGKEGHGVSDIRRFVTGIRAYRYMTQILLLTDETAIALLMRAARMGLAVSDGVTVATSPTPDGRMIITVKG